MEPFIEDISLSRADAASLVAAISVSLGLLAETRESADDFVRAGVDKLFGAEYAAQAAKVGRLICDRQDGLRKSVELNSLVAENLPSLRACDVTVDFRPLFDGASIIGGVSVALVHIDTDARPEIWLQLSRGEVRILIDKFTKALSKMEAAEAVFTMSSR